MSSAQKIRSIARNLEQLIEELPIFLLRLEEVTTAFDEKLEWREFKFCFKVGTSKVVSDVHNGNSRNFTKMLQSSILQKLLTHHETLKEVMTQVCELVQRDTFTQSLQHLGLLDLGPGSGADCPKMSSVACLSPGKHNHSYKVFKNNGWR